MLKASAVAPVPMTEPYQAGCFVIVPAPSNTPWEYATNDAEMVVAMARTVIMGAGIAGHTAALHLRRMLGKDHEVVVIAPNSKWNWIPSSIWVGVGSTSARASSSGRRT
jgi:hypothetical protein